MGFALKAAAMVIGVGVAVVWARGADLGHPHPTAADVPAAQRTLDRAEAFLAQHTGSPYLPKHLVAGLPEEVRRADGIAASRGQEIVAEDRLVVSWARMDQRPGLVNWNLESARVALHEAGHADDDVPGDPLDEGIRDAVALDLVAPFTFAQTGDRAIGYGGADDSATPGWTTRIRALSARATCSRPQGYAARRWRAEISVATRAGRLAGADAAARHVCLEARRRPSYAAGA